MGSRRPPQQSVSEPILRRSRERSQMTRPLAKTLIAGLLASGSTAVGSLPASAALASSLPELAAHLDAGTLSTGTTAFAGAATATAASTVGLSPTRHWDWRPDRWSRRWGADRRRGSISGP